VGDGAYIYSKRYAPHVRPSSAPTYILLRTGHINNLYNTTFWTLVQKGGLENRVAEKELSGTVSSDKNEILFKRFGINYNNEPEIFKKGSVLYRDVILPPLTLSLANVTVLPDIDTIVADTRKISNNTASNTAVDIKTNVSTTRTNTSRSIPLFACVRDVDSNGINTSRTDVPFHLHNPVASAVTTHDPDALVHRCL
jgi:hypothetical protein